MATIDYKEKYEQALEKARQLCAYPTSKPFISDLQDLFPELAESEDERIRKALIRFHKSTIDVDGIKGEDIIAWLEKQGEHAKFRESIQIGDEVTRNKDGMLVNLSQLNRVAKKDEKQGEQKSFAKYKVGDTIYYNSFGRLVNFVIANIVEDGTDNPMYEDKDGNSVFQNDIVEQKPAELSEEDKKILKEVISNYESAYLPPVLERERILKELKSLRPNHWKPTEDQMKQLGWVAKQNKDNMIGKELMTLYNDLQKLREE